MNKFIILVVAISFILSLNFAFAADENATNLPIGSSDLEEEIPLELPENKSSDNLEAADDLDEVLSQETQDSNHNSISKGNVAKRGIDGVIYQATFYGLDGAPLEYSLVYCGVNSPFNSLEEVTDANGVAKFYLPLDKGTYKLYLQNPVTGGMVQEDLKVFDVLDNGKNLNTYFGSGKYYSVRVFDDHGPVSAGKKVTFLLAYKKIDGKTNKVSNVKKTYTFKTDKKGFAKLKVDLQPGTYSVLAKYGDYVALNSINIKPTLIHYENFKVIGKKHIKYRIKLLNTNGKVLKNKKITVKFNKKTYTAKTNKKGIAIFKIKIPKKLGKYKLVSKYKKATASSWLEKYRIY